MICRNPRRLCAGSRDEVIVAAEPGRSADPVYPLKVSANGRYLVDQNNVPYLITAIPLKL